MSEADPTVAARLRAYRRRQALRRDAARSAVRQEALSK